jgi:Dolichyl-phosphate-mannose-protein mannosyltransferase
MGIWNQWRTLVCLAAALLMIAVYYVFGFERANSFVFRFGNGTFFWPGHDEEDFMFFYTVMGLYAGICIFLCFMFHEKLGQLRPFFRQLAYNRMFLPLMLMFAFAMMLGARFLLFDRAPLTDDENAYLFVAKTLLTGKLMNPSPPFFELFRNQSVFADQFRWFAEYTIGHPIFLALGCATALTDFIIPIASAGTIFLVYLIAKDQFDERTARIAVVLIALSAQFILTSGTLLGYPTASLCSCLLILSGLHFYSSRRPLWLVTFIIANTLLLLNRPHSWISLGIPLALFFIVKAFRDRDSSKLLEIAGMGLATAISVGIFLGANKLQTGNAFHTIQYYVMTLISGPDAGFGFGSHIPGGTHTLHVAIANLALSLTRQNIWVFGWPFSLFFLIFAGRSRFVYFLVGWAILFYGLLTQYYSPGISLTGPVHYFEMIIPAVLLTARGIIHLDEIFRNNLRSQFRAEVVPALTASLYLCSVLMFVPPVLGSLKEMSYKASAVYRALDENRVHNAIVFVNNIVSDSCSTWVFWAKNSGPDLEKEDILYVRWPKDPERMANFLKTFPSREVWGVVRTGKGGMALIRQGDEFFDRWEKLVKIPVPQVRCR